MCRPGDQPLQLCADERAGGALLIEPVATKLQVSDLGGAGKWNQKHQSNVAPNRCLVGNDWSATLSLSGICTSHKLLTPVAGLSLNLVL